MKRSFIYDQGTSREQEDGIINSYWIVGVLDGVSKPYGPNVPPLILDSMSSGEWVVRRVEKFFSAFRNAADVGLPDMIEAANNEVEIGLKELGHFLPKELRPGATFAIAKIGPKMVEISQAGDSFYVALLKNGNVVRSDYKRKMEILDRSIADQIMSDVARSSFACSPEEVSEKDRSVLRQEFWKIYLPKWVAMRKSFINNISNVDGFGLLNGEPELPPMTSNLKFPRAEVETLLLFTDGMVGPGIVEKTDFEICHGVLNAYKSGGWPAVLMKVRHEEAIVAAKNYIDQGEATGYALEF